MENRYKITLDLKNRSVSNIKFKQGNTDSSVLEINLIDNNIVKDITGQTITFKFAKPDGTVVFQDSTTGVSIIDALKGNFQCILKNNTLAASGIVNCEIEFSSAGKILSTSKFNFTVEGSIVGGSLSSNYISAIENKLIEMQTTFDENEATRQATFNTIKNEYDLSLHENTDIEIVNARKGEVNLGAKIGKLDSQLAEMPTQTYITEKEKTVDVNAKLALKADSSIVALKAEKTEVTAVSNQIASIIANNGNGTTPTELIDLRTGADGTVYTTVKQRADAEYNKIPYKSISSTGITNTTALASFPNNTVSVMTFGYSDTNGFPTKAGTLEIHRIGGANDYHFQLWYDAFTNVVWKRRYNGAGVASVWEPLSTVQKIANTGLNNASLITAFPSDTISVTTFLNADNAGFPTLAGTLETHRSSKTEALSFQLWHDTLTNNVWNRRFDSSGVAQAWESNVNKVEFNSHVAKILNPIPKVRKPLVTFTSDDGFDTDYTVLKPIISTKGVPMTIFCATDPTVGTMMTPAHMLELQNVYGCEIGSHTRHHVDLTTLTEANIILELSESKTYLTNLGLNVKNFSYPTGNNDVKVRKLVKQYYRSACAGSFKYKKINKDTISKTNIVRVLLGSFDDIQIADLPTVSTLDYYKAMVDMAIAQNGWLVFDMHAGNALFTPTQIGYVSDIIDYIKSLNVDIVTIDKGLDIYENYNEIGDYNNSEKGKGINIAENGITNIPICIFTKSDIVGDSGVTNSTKLREFPENKVSYTPCYYSETNGFPTQAGMLVTNKISDEYDNHYQEWKDAYSNRTWKRRFVSTSPREWEETINTPIVSMNTYSNSTLYADFPANKITYCSINTSGATGLPGGVSGNLITYKFHPDSVGRQEWMPYNNNEKWSRYVVYATQLWSPWIKVSAV